MEAEITYDLKAACEHNGIESADIAGILGVPKGTVWSRLHHARLDLAKAMEER